MKSAFGRLAVTQVCYPPKIKENSFKRERGADVSYSLTTQVLPGGGPDGPRRDMQDQIDELRAWVIELEETKSHQADQIALLQTTLAKCERSLRDRERMVEGMRTLYAVPSPQ